MAFMGSQRLKQQARRLYDFNQVLRIYIIAVSMTFFVQLLTVETSTALTLPPAPGTLPSAWLLCPDSI